MQYRSRRLLSRPCQAAVNNMKITAVRFSTYLQELIKTGSSLPPCPTSSAAFSFSRCNKLLTGLPTGFSHRTSKPARAWRYLDHGDQAVRESGPKRQNACLVLPVSYRNDIHRRAGSVCAPAKCSRQPGDQSLRMLSRRRTSAT